MLKSLYIVLDDSDKQHLVINDKLEIIIECNNNKYTVNVLADEHGAVKTQLIGFDKYEELKH